MPAGEVPGPPIPIRYAAAFATVFLFFLQLRIADEFKDYAEDCRAVGRSGRCLADWWDSGN